MIDILLAAYNGEKYIGEQIESVLAQDFRDFRLIIRDDASADRTADIVRHYEKRYPHKISFNVNKENSGCAGANFFAMLREARGDYVMFCDQDDVWFSDKISKSLKKIQKAEKKYGEATPLLLHTDLTVTDENLNVRAKSMFAYQHLNRDSVSVKKLMVQNVATGCTFMLNRALADRLLYTPKSVPVHDWWIALYTACCGRIVFLDEPTLFYRQHGTNTCGARDMGDVRYMADRLSRGKNASLMLKYGYRQAAEMYEVLKNEGDKELGELLKGYGELEGKPYLKRLAFVLKNGVLKDGIVRKAGQILFL